MLHTISLRRKSWLIFGFSAQSWTPFHSVCPECFYEIMSREPPDHKPCTEMCPGPQTEQPIHYDASALSRDHTADQILCSGGQRWSVWNRMEMVSCLIWRRSSPPLLSFQCLSYLNGVGWSSLFPVCRSGARQQREGGCGPFCGGLMKLLPDTLLRGLRSNRLHICETLPRWGQFDVLLCWAAHFVRGSEKAERVWSLCECEDPELLPLTVSDFSESWGNVFSPSTRCLSQHLNHILSERRRNKE